MNTIIVSDMDGTLLDAGNYSFRDALPALALIEERGIPLILCSSKTRAEIEVYRRCLNNRHPFITENGGGIFIPEGYFPFPFDSKSLDGYSLIALGLPYADILYQFSRLRGRMPVRARGFADMSNEEVAALTGLTPPAARLARQRDFDEAFVFEGEPDMRFLHAIESIGLSWTQGRIFHIMGKHDKGRAVNILLSLYRKQYGAVSSIGLGDGFNDLPMLQAVDRPVLVRHPDGGYESRVELPGLLKTQLPGPLGWNEAVLQLLAKKPEPESGAQMDAPALLRNIFNAALSAADPYRAVQHTLRFEDGRMLAGDAAYELGAYERIVVVGAGKAAARMALAVEELLGERIARGLVIVKHGHTAPLQRIEQIEAAHPLPDAAGERGARRILDMLRSADAKTLVLCLLSGGASALLVAPAAGLTLEDKQQATDLLLRAGASIAELNALRKHLSAVKGGRLAQAASPAQVLTLLLSDVIGDPLDVIASGPTAPDASSFADAWAVLEKYGLQEKMPERVRAHLQRGLAGQEAESAKPDDPCFASTRNLIVGSLSMALDAAQEQAGRLGLRAELMDAAVQGEARSVARELVEEARARQAELPAGERLCLLYGGETTVTVTGSGKGGRNQELSLAFALALDGASGITLLSAGTDGTDGPTDAAGAIVDGNTAALAQKAGLEMQHFLAENDAYNFFRLLDEKAGTSCHLKTGPTGTNVMDLQIVLLSKEE